MTQKQVSSRSHQISEQEENCDLCDFFSWPGCKETAPSWDFPTERLPTGAEKHLRMHTGADELQKQKSTSDSFLFRPFFICIMFSD